MNALAIFREYRSAVTARWVEEVFATYPLDTTGFARTHSDQFANPVGEMTTTLAGYLYDAATGEHVIADRLREALERFVKLRSVQDFTPSRGLGVIYVMKQLLREATLDEFVKAHALPDYLEAESRIDTLALMAFDMYISTRETLAEQRIKEIRDKHSQIVRWAQHAQRGVKE